MLAGVDSRGLAADPAELRAWRKEIATEVRGNILEYWLREAPNPRTGTFHGAVFNGAPLPESERGSLLTARILWAFSNAYRRDSDARYLAMAERAYADLSGNFWDAEHGGLIWSRGSDGQPADTTKQTYGQAFGIYALAEYHRATGEPEALHHAIRLFRLLERHAIDPVHGGYRELRRADWGEPGLLDRWRVEPADKSQNTHLHLMEAYTNLLRVWPDPGLREAQRRLVELMLDRILDPGTLHLGLHFDADWTRTTSKNVSYGHDIEAAWLLTEAAAVLGDADLQARVRVLAVSIADVVRSEGVGCDGGLINLGSPEGPVDAARDWWSQAEAVVGFLNAYQLSGESRFLDAARDSWRFIAEKIIDRERGGWRWGVTADGQPVERPQISLWKCPYHNSRACYEAMDRIDALLAASGAADPP